MAKKIACIIIVLCLSFSPAVGAYQVDVGDEFAVLTGIGIGTPVAEARTASKPQFELDAQSAILVERETGEVLYEKNSDEPRAIASITKIMTLILVMEAVENGAIKLEDEVTTSEHAYSMGGSQIWLEPGEKMTVDELLRAVAVVSANDAAVALAEFVGGSEESFVVQMNEKAAALGMTGTVFKNANGLDEEGHISCARDVAAMSREVLRHELVRNYVTVWMDELRGGETQLTNTNKMLKSFNGITGIKTGTTDKAGVCVSASALRDGMELIAVVLGSSDSKSRFAAATEILNYGFAYYELAKIDIKPSDLNQIRVKLGEKDYCEYIYSIPKSIVVSKGKRDSVSYEAEIAETISAPVEKGQTVGVIKIYSSGEMIGEYPITSCEAIDKIGFFSGLGMLFRALCEM
ncbi:MAG: D-alanyl-D-alanine carboxypeptidase family protein [Oscillospiraceae bacterium]